MSLLLYHLFMWVSCLISSDVLLWRRASWLEIVLQRFLHALRVRGSRLFLLVRLTLTARQAATCTRSTYGCGSLEGEDQGLEAEMWLILNEDRRSVCSGGSGRDGRPEKEGRKQGKLMQWGNKLQCALIYINVY